MIEKIYNIIDLMQGSVEWYDFRKGKIGASMAPAIMGVSPFQTPKQLWEEIVLETSRPPSSAMIRGSMMEKVALEWVRNEFKVDYRPIVTQSKEHPWMIASLDGWQDHMLSLPPILEIKCPGMETHLKALEGKIPENYYPQLQHQMAVTGSKDALYVSFDGESGISIVVERSEEYIQKLISSEMAFIQSIIDFNCPDPNEKDRIVIDQPELLIKSERYVDLDRLIEELQTEKDEIKAFLLKNLTHSKNLVGRLKISKVNRKGSIDYSKISVLKGMDLDVYRKKPIETWMITY